MMLELSYLSLLPFPVLLALVGSIVVSIVVFIQSCMDVVTCPPQTPELYYMESSLNDHVLAKCKMRDRMFQPSFWFRCNHVQTCLPIILPRPDVTFEREYLQMADKGVVALDWVMTPHLKVRRKTPVLLVIPSMTEGAVSLASICSLAIGRGIKPVVFNRRGFGGSYLTTPKLTTSGDPSDLRQVVVYIKQRLPKSPMAAIAYGSGCGLLLSYLGEFGSSTLLSVAVCISPTFDEPARFSSHFQSLYDLLLLLRLKQTICRHLPALSPVIDADGLFSSWTFDKLNESVYSPFSSSNSNNTAGEKCSSLSSSSSFSQAFPSNNATTMTSSYCSSASSGNDDQFWESNNSMRDVDDIAVPILCIRSLDDPINPSSEIPYNLFKCYPNFLLIVTEKGGHCGFLEDGFPPKSWSDRLSLDYIESVIEFTTAKTHSLPPPSNLTSPRPGSAPPVLRNRYYSISGVTGIGSVTARGGNNLFFHGYRHSSDGSNYSKRRKSGGAKNNQNVAGSGSGGGGGGGGSDGSGGVAGVYCSPTERSNSSGSGRNSRKDSSGSGSSGGSGSVGGGGGIGGNGGGNGGGWGISSKVKGGGPILLRKLSSLSSHSKPQRSTL